MKLSPDAIRRRRRTQGIVFAASALAILALAWLTAGEAWPRLPLFAIPLATLTYISPALRIVPRILSRLAARPLVAAAIVGGLALASGAATSYQAGIQAPSVHDEFSYLLAGDTFAHGRLTNRPHPMWVHFEAQHILQQPTYMSKYPPGQGLALALGQVLLGLPIAGVWISAGLACGALTWMLAGWMPGRWALAGGLLGIVHPLTRNWSQTYWGGLVAVLGGALLVGALRRIVRRPRPRHAVVMGVGLGILANSRPYEGLALAVPLGLALAVWLVSRRGPPASIALRRVVLPIGAVLLAVGGGMLYYNYRVTGDPLTMPYMVYQRAYIPMPAFVFQSPSPPPEYRHDDLRRFFDNQPPRPVERTLKGLAARLRERAEAYAAEYFGSLQILALILLLSPLERDGWYFLAFLDLVLFTGALGLQSWRLAHYAAPGAGLALLLAMRALRGVGRWRLGRLRIGWPLAHALWIVAMCAFIPGWWHAVVAARRPEGWHEGRARIAATLGESGGKHLVMVRYGPKHNVHAQWVYNAADIDAARVVWAHEMDAASNARLLDYFKDRQVWLVEPDAPEVRAAPYVEAAGRPASGGQD